MAGITKRKDTWYAGFRINGKLKILTTGIKISPSIPAGKTKSAGMKEAELQASLIHKYHTNLAKNMSFVYRIHNPNS